MYNAWSIFIVVTVPEITRSWKLRIFFLFMCFTPLLSAVLQAFFVSYLVEPGYGEKFETFQELLDCSVSFGSNDAFEFCVRTMEYNNHLKFPLKRRVNCVDLKTCLMRMMTDGEFTTISALLYDK
jgi:hypothetical protein